jgi:hypothetical protein
MQVAAVVFDASEQIGTHVSCVVFDASLQPYPVAGPPSDHTGWWNLRRASYVKAPSSMQLASVLYSGSLQLGMHSASSVSVITVVKLLAIELTK